MFLIFFPNEQCFNLVFIEILIVAQLSAWYKGSRKENNTNKQKNPNLVLDGIERRTIFMYFLCVKFTARCFQHTA